MAFNLEDDNDVLDADDDILLEDGEPAYSGPPMTPDELELVETHFGRGDKRARITTKPITVNQLLRKSGGA